MERPEPRVIAGEEADLAGDLAGDLAAAERRRFELGASDFFLFNMCEEAPTDARFRLLNAQERAALAGPVQGCRPGLVLPVYVCTMSMKDWIAMASTAGKRPANGIW